MRPLNWHLIATIFGFLLWGILAPLACSMYIDVKELREHHTQLEGSVGAARQQIDINTARLGIVEDKVTLNSLKIERLFATIDYYEHQNGGTDRFKRRKE